MGLATLLTSVTILGGSSFVAGILPLTVSLSKPRLAQLSTLGTGLLLGAAMGVIIPEGIEATYDSFKPSNNATSPSLHVAVSLLSGFTFMFLLEQLLAPMLESRGSGQFQNAQYAMAPTSSGTPPETPNPVTPAPDLDLELEAELNALGVETREVETRRNPRMMTLGLVVHSLADGLALGAANTLNGATTGGDVSKESAASGLSFIVFIAIAVHKAPTALALTSSLVSQLSVRKIRQHLIAFSVTSPLSALITYGFINFFGGAQHVEQWTGSVLMFSGGTFLYVATVLSALPSHSHGDTSHHEPSHLSRKTVTTLTVLGMCIPVILSALVGHEH